MAKQENPVKEAVAKKPEQPAHPGNDEFKAKSDLDGKNDSGPDPEIHNKDH
jgi:hypothetical protein